MKKSNAFNNVSPTNGKEYKYSNSIYTPNSSLNVKNELSFQSTKKSELNESPTVSAKSKKISQDFTEVLKKVVAVLGVTTITVAGVSSVGVNTPESQALFTYVETYDSGVFYELDYNQVDDTMIVVLYNDFTNRENSVSTEEHYGYFENLATNMQYTLALKKGNKVLSKRTVVTKNSQTKDEPFYEQEPTTSDDPAAYTNG